METAAKKSAEELVVLKKHYAEWESKFKHIIAKKLELEQFIEDFGRDMSENLKCTSPTRVILTLSWQLSSDI